MVCDGLPLDQVVEMGGREVIVSCCEGRIAILQDGFKLCRNRYDRTGQEYMELYDLNRDPHEFENLWDQPEYREQQTVLLAALQQWEEKYGALSVLFEGKNQKGKPYWYAGK